MGYPHLVKKCSGCTVTKPVDEFYVSASGTKGRDGYCKDCRRDRDRARADGRNKLVAAKLAKDPLYFRRKKLLTMYGLTVDQYNAMHAEQDGKCALCQEPESRVLYGKMAYLSVDHDHATGKVRSLLCHRCNTALGIVEDRPFRLRALAYLRAHR